MWKIISSIIFPFFLLSSFGVDIVIFLAQKLHRQELIIIIWTVMSALWEMEGIMMDNSGQRCLLDTTILNNKCRPWLGHIMKLLTDALSVSGVCQIPTGIHCIGMEQWNNVPCQSNHNTAHHYGL